MELKSLKGEHMFSGVDYSKGKEGETNILFCLDGVTYIAEEDPDDGYRSYMKDLRISETPCKNTFEPERVFCDHTNKSSFMGYDSDILIIKNPFTANVILKIGTVDVNDYYPSCVMEYHPENMQCNLRRRM